MPKFKTKKKKAANNRKFTESLPRKTETTEEKSKEVKKSDSIFGNLINYLNLFFLFLGISLIILLGITLVNYEKAQEQKRQMADNFLYWQDVVRVHPNLTDAYYNAAIYAVKLGENDKALVFLDKAIKLDPDFVKAKQLRAEIKE